MKKSNQKTFAGDFGTDTAFHRLRWGRLQAVSVPKAPAKVLAGFFRKVLLLHKKSGARAPLFECSAGEIWGLDGLEVDGGGFAAFHGDVECHFLALVQAAEAG